MPKSPVTEDKERFESILEKIGKGRQHRLLPPDVLPDDDLSEVIGDEGGGGTSAGGEPYSRSGRGLGRHRSRAFRRAS